MGSLKKLKKIYHIMKTILFTVLGMLSVSLTGAIKLSQDAGVVCDPTLDENCDNDLAQEAEDDCDPTVDQNCDNDLAQEAGDSTDCPYGHDVDGECLRKKSGLAQLKKDTDCLHGVDLNGDCKRPRR